MKGFVSIFQHLGRFIRQISVVLTRNLTKRDNQHVWFPLHEQPFRLQILRNFVLQEPRTRKTCLTEPLRRIIEPLRRKTEPHCGITEPLRRNMIEPLRRNVEHHCEIIEPIMRNIWLHCETNKTLLRKIEHFCSKAKIFRNDCDSNNTTRPFGGTAVYSRIQLIPGSPYCLNRNGVELTIIKCMYLPHLTIIGVYRSPKVPVTQLCIALRQVLLHTTTQYNIFLGDFNVNWLNQTDRVPLYNLFITENNYRQLVSLYTTDSKTAIDHIYTNLPESQAKLHLLETYFSDHKTICALINYVNTET